MGAVVLFGEGEGVFDVGGGGFAFLAEGGGGWEVEFLEEGLWAGVDDEGTGAQWGGEFGEAGEGAWAEDDFGDGVEVEGHGGKLE